MSSGPSRTAALFWSCASYDFYRRVADTGAGRTITYLLLMACAAAVSVTLFFGSQILPPFRRAAHTLPAMVLSGGRLVMSPNAPAVLYDDGPHAMLLIRQAVDREPPTAERPYDAVITLLSGGLDANILGFRLRLDWPSNLALDLQSLDATAFMDAWWLFLCMSVFAGAVIWFFVTRLIHAIVASFLVMLMTGPTRSSGFVSAFNIAAYAMTPGTWLMMGLLWTGAIYRFPPALLAWNWTLYVATGLVFLFGAVSALPSRPTNPWQHQNAAE